MRLLVVTQKIDQNDPILGFFHNWVLKLSEKFEKISVICLEKGKYDLPSNVKVYSLGKESGRSKIKYVKNFLNFILGLHKDYDAVFVHMNQEYVLIGGFFWKLMRKKVYMWRNHRSGSICTDIASVFCNKVFCTSKYSYTAKYKKTILMPAGIDTNDFKYHKIKQNKILFLGRVSIIKKPDLIIEALGVLCEKGIDFVCNFYGDPLPKDEEFYASIKNRVKDLSLDSKVNFYKAVPNYETPKIYNEHSIFINLTPSGSFDKTILEAASCGCIVIVANQSLVGEIDDQMVLKNVEPKNIAKTIEFWLNESDENINKASEKLQKYVTEKHSLESLADKICQEIKNK